MGDDGIGTPRHGVCGQALPPSREVLDEAGRGQTPELKL
jgi:hypothetical protein